MRIAGLQKLTLIDYPGEIAATIFTQGCNWRCGYCHNPELVLPSYFQEPIPEEFVLEFLNPRVPILEKALVRQRRIIGAEHELVLQPAANLFFERVAEIFRRPARKLVKYVRFVDQNGNHFLLPRP